MKNLSLLAALLAGCCACGTSLSPQECHRFRNGTFSYHFRGPQHDVSFLITRQGNLQTEVNQRTGAVSKLAVTWLDDCTYQLRLLETTEHFPKEIEEYRRSAPLTTAILGCTDQYYLFHTQRKTTDPVLTDTMWIAR